MKLISICPSNTEILAYLGLENDLIAVDDFSDWPSGVADLPKLGPDLSIDMDILEKMEPELVLASLSVPGMEKNVAELERRGIPHLVLNPNSLAEIANDLRVVAQACHIPDLGIDRASQFEDFINQMRSIAKSCTSFPSCYWEWWPNPIFTPGNVNWLTEISEIAGGYNLFRDVELASVQTDWEDVRLRNPDYIFLAWVGVPYNRIKPSLIMKRPDWPELSAISEERTHVMEEWLYCRPSPRLLEGALKLAKILHPEEYSKLELPNWVSDK
ncbi:cobalamin-binding protein [Rummeliibacillus pycnus]|uniref:cobalamin-binding protein n=1 Tax=Rummeliibacillus pycnus TaxID=101070 RepID=UPI003D2E24CC